MRVSSAEQCRALDAQAIETWGVPGVALMEVASRGVALAIEERFAQHLQQVLVAVGTGNNGGDGFAVARWLKRAGIPVQAWVLGETGTEDARVMRKAAAAVGVPFVDEPGNPSLIVDAIFGTGLNRDVEGVFREAIQQLAMLPCPVVAVDLPSGLNTDNGKVLGVALQASHTVSFARAKPAFFSANAALCGSWEVVDIGVDPTGHTLATTLDATQLQWPARPSGAHKNRLGHLAVLAGSPSMAGAAVLCCEGALRAGVGLVTLFVNPQVTSRLTSLSPTVMVHSCEFGEALERSQGFDAVAVGPGLSGGDALPTEMRQGLEALWQSRSTVVFDADALLPFSKPCEGHKVISPHPGEAGRILRQSTAEVQADRFAAARALGRLGATTVLKGPHTLIQEGPTTWVNTTASSVLATAGSGDVLTGVIGALLARGVSPGAAARLGVHVHGRAGQQLDEVRREGWTALDIAHQIPHAIGELHVASG